MNSTNRISLRINRTFIAQRVIVDRQLAIQKHLLELPLRFFSESKVGEIVSRVTKDVTVIQGVLTEAPISFLRHLVTIIGGVVLMLTMNWLLTLVIFGIRVVKSFTQERFE